MYLCNDLWLERGHNIVEHGPLLSDVPGSKLGLNLSEPDMPVSGPKWRELDIHSSNVSAYACETCPFASLSINRMLLT